MLGVLHMLMDLTLITFQVTFMTLGEASQHEVSSD